MCKQVDINWGVGRDIPIRCHLVFVFHFLSFPSSDAADSLYSILRAILLISGVSTNNSLLDWNVIPTLLLCMHASKLFLFFVGTVTRSDYMVLIVAVYLRSVR